MYHCSYMNIPVDHNDAIVATSDNVPPALLFEMLRSFVVLSETLNLSHAVQKLGSTRQTVRRHIASLEEVKGGLLFEVLDRRYALSDLGERLLPEARDIVAGASAWYNGNSGLIDGLQYIYKADANGWYFYQQQHAIGKVFSSTGDLLPKVLLGWAESGGQLDHEAMRAVRPFCSVFRRFEKSLIFAEVGEESSFLSWFGEANGRSAVGRPLEQMPGGGDFGRLVDLAYREVETTESLRLDHVHTLMPYGDSGKLSPVAYERLMLAARFPDQSLAIVFVSRRTYDVEIKGVSQAMIRQMSEGMTME